MTFLRAALANAHLFYGPTFGDDFQDMHAFIESAIKADPSDPLRVTVRDIVESVIREPNSSAELLLAIPFDLVESDPELAEAMAGRNDCPVELLEYLAFSPFEGVLDLVEQHENKSWIVLDSVSKTRAVLKDPATADSAATYSTGFGIVLSSDELGQAFEALWELGDEGQERYFAIDANGPTFEQSLLPELLSLQHPRIQPWVIERIATKWNTRLKTISKKALRARDMSVIDAEKTAQEITDGSAIADLLASVAAHPETPGSCLKELAKTDYPEVLKALAKNAKTSKPNLKQFIKKDQADLLNAVASHPSKHIQSLFATLFKAPGRATHRHLAANPYLFPEQYQTLSDISDLAVLEALASNPKLPKPLLERLAKHRDHPIRSAAARNTSATGSTLITLAEDEHHEVRAAVAGNWQTPATVLELLATDASNWKALCLNPLAPHRILSDLATNTEHLPILARNIRLPIDIQKQIASTGSHDALGHLAANRSTAGEVLALIEERTDEAAIKLTVLLNKNTPLSVASRLLSPSLPWEISRLALVTLWMSQIDETPSFKSYRIQQYVRSLNIQHG